METHTTTLNSEKFFYDNKIVKYFIYATLFWAILGFSFGLLTACLLFLPQIPEYVFGSETHVGFLGHGIQGLKDSNGHMAFGRMRMIHTTIVIFAFVGNGMFAGIYYSMQRLLKTRMYSDLLTWINFWGWQLFIVASVITFIMGINTSKEYSEHEWPIDLLTGTIWILFGVNMFGTIAKRRVRHMYVAIWFYIATFIGVAMLHIFNNLAIPLTLTKSYSIYAGVQDAMVQWWYGHNAVAFILTTPILGMMYYYVPKISNRPVFSYKLSIIHFWSLIFIYIWAGAHHLLYTALPSWTQAVGTAFSIMLIAPSWGGMLNGLLTLRGAWDKVRENPVLKFMVVGLTCYGMATFEGPLLATKAFNKVGHFTDWVIAHVHVGTLGWNGFMIFAVIYWLIPKLFNTKLYSERMANAHFWLGTLGILFYVIPMYLSGITQGLMWKQFNDDGTLTNTFLETVTSLRNFYILRAIGGTLYITGAILMVINIWQTTRTGVFVANEAAEAPALTNIGMMRKKGEKFHPWLERMPLTLTVLSAIVLSIGGAVEIIPTIVIKSNIPTISAVKPYSALELEGRDIYIANACNACHSQMVRPFRDEVVRYGEYSKAGEFVYDHPFLWGSKRTGPDLHREGGKNPDSWHFKHMYNPQITSKGSIMPRFPWLHVNKADFSQTENKMKLMRGFDIPYSDSEITNAQKSIKEQSEAIVKRIYSEAPDVKEQFEKEKLALGTKFVPLEQREIVALTAYLQRLGTDIKAISTKSAMQ